MFYLFLNYLISHVDGIPLDGTPVNVTVPIILPLAITYYILATAGNIFAVICLLFNIIFRKRK